MQIIITQFMLGWIVAVGILVIGCLLGIGAWIGRHSITDITIERK